MARRQNKFSDIGTKRHALFFFLIYIAGAVILTFEKWIVYRLFTEFTFIGDGIIIFSAMFLMGAYVFFVTLVPATKLRTDVAADNVYYLGFLYTLTSLAIALSIDSADAILANFGVAIISTLIGIAARVGLNQLRVDPTDIEEASRLELADATRKVRAELQETVRQLTDFRNVSLQVLSEGYEEVQKNVENISNNVLKSVEDLVERSAKPLDELVTKTKAANDEAVQSLAGLTKSNKDLAKSNKDMVNQIAAVNQALAELSEHYGDTGIIDDKVINSVQQQLLTVQNQLTEKAREEFAELKSSVQEASKNTQELRSDLIKDKKKFSNKTTSETEIFTDEENDNSVQKTTAPKIRATKAFDKHSSLNSITHMGTRITFDENGSNYSVGNKNYSSLEEARSAIDTSAGISAQQAIKSASDDD